MLEMLFNFIPQWLPLYKTPMNPARRQWWEKARKLGCALFVTVVTIGIGGIATIFDISWDLLAHHHTVSGLDINIRIVWWFSGALVVGLVEWYLNESRFRLPPRADTSDGPGSNRMGSRVL